MEPQLQEKRWTKEMEKPVYETWKIKTPYQFNPKTQKAIFSIDTPPPYVNAPVHMGHACTYAIMDFIARYKRMTGHHVLFPLGLDRNGLPIEVAAEKAFNIRAHETPRKEFIEKCHQILEKSSLESVDSFYRAGISFNSWTIGNKPGEIYQTDSPHYRQLTQDTFIDLYKKGLIYEDNRVNNYCPGCQTTIADSEIEYKEKNTLFTDITFQIKDSNETITIGTTRPEFLSTCAMILYHPDDPRYTHLQGKTAIVPLYATEVLVKADPTADSEKGTGLVMMCAFGDLTDVRFFREQGLNPTIAINQNGTINEHGGFLQGLPVKKARTAILEKLKEKNLIVAQKEVRHRTPICERSKHDIEFIEMKEFYCKQVEFKDTMRSLSNKLTFYAPESRQILLDWIDKISIDWPISRRRFYATEVPLWYCKRCDEIVLPPKGKYYQPWKENPPIEYCAKCRGTEFIGDVRVFDTWFDSSISPLYILQWSRDNELFAKATPCSLRPQGKEIVRTWLYYTVLKDYLLTNELIFKDTWIHHHIVDDKGKKMSKSSGNIIDPQEVINRFGAEPFRLWVAVEGNLESTDFRCSFERIEGAGKTLTKLWNVARFISMFPEPQGEIELLQTDKWIMNECDRLIHRARDCYDRYDFHNPVIEIKHFIWETYASHYVELVKSRAYNQTGVFTAAEQNGSLHTLRYCLQILLQLLAPINPMITSVIYSTIFKANVHETSFPQEKKEHTVPFTTAEVLNLNTHIWKVKKDAGKSLKDPIHSLHIPEHMGTLIKDLMATHTVETIETSKDIRVTV